MRIIHLVTSYHPASCRAIAQAHLENVGMMVRYGKCGNVGMMWVKGAFTSHRPNGHDNKTRLARPCLSLQQVHNAMTRAYIVNMRPQKDA